MFPSCILKKKGRKRKFSILLFPLLSLPISLPFFPSKSFQFGRIQILLFYSWFSLPFSPFLSFNETREQPFCVFLPFPSLNETREQSVKDRCLIYIECGRVYMHQLIKEMGREVVRQESPNNPGEQSRLWNHQMSFNLLKENRGTSKIKGLSLDMRMISGSKSTSIVNMNSRSYGDRTTRVNKETLKFRAIEKMENLMLLQLDYATFSGSCKKFPKKLRLLRWHGVPFKTVPSDVPLENLAVLDLRYSKLKQVWDRFKLVGSLKILNLSYSVELIKTPDFRGLPSLESLILKGCLSLIEVCESIGCLEMLVLLDISGCRSLKDIPRLPKSLKSLKMKGCNLGGHGQVQCLNSCNFLVEIDISGCNLFDNSFPEDWSNLFSLKKLEMSGNHITSLPGCVKSLPSLEELDASYCVNLKSVLYLPKSIIKLDLYQNMSLEIVQPTPNPIEKWSMVDCNKLFEVVDCFKFKSIKKVERKIRRYLGLENANTEEDESTKVSYEFGIFSAFVPRERLPCYRYKEIGSKISFRVPSHPNGLRISGLNVCFMCTNSTSEMSNIMYVEVSNKTKVLEWKYFPTIDHPIFLSNYVWLSLWRTGNLLDDGDEIDVSIRLLGDGDGDVDDDEAVDECCVNLVYNDDDEEEMDVVLSNGISWSDRMWVEVSDYVHTRKTYCFGINSWYDDSSIVESNVDWWGLNEDTRTTFCYGMDALEVRVIEVPIN